MGRDPFVQYFLANMASFVKMSLRCKVQGSHGSTHPSSLLLLGMGGDKGLAEPAFILGERMVWGSAREHPAGAWWDRDWNLFVGLIEKIVTG